MPVLIPMPPHPLMDTCMGTCRHASSSSCRGYMGAGPRVHIVCPVRASSFDFRPAPLLGRAADAGWILAGRHGRWARAGSCSSSFWAVWFRRSGMEVEGQIRRCWHPSLSFPALPSHRPSGPFLPASAAISHQYWGPLLCFPKPSVGEGRRWGERQRNPACFLHRAATCFASQSSSLARK